MARVFCYVLVGLLGTAAAVSPSWAYVDHLSSFTLGRVVREAPRIEVVRVGSVDPGAGVLHLEKVRDLKGETAEARSQQQAGENLPPAVRSLILRWAEPGKTAVVFHNGKTSLTCIGRYWYRSRLRPGAEWTITEGQGHLGFAYFGSACRLADAIPAILAGQQSVIPTLQWSARRDLIFENVVRSRDCPVHRTKADLKMPDFAFELGPAYDAGAGAGGPADVRALLNALKGDDPIARREAAEELGEIGPAAHDAVAALSGALLGPDLRLGVSAAVALLRIAPGEGPALQKLLGALTDRSPEVRMTAADALGEIGPLARPAVPALIERLKERDPAVRQEAMEALGHVGPDARAALEPLQQALSDASATIRCTAAHALGGLGPAAHAALPMLARALNDVDPQTRRQSAWAMMKIGVADTQYARPVAAVLGAKVDDPWEWAAALAVLVRLSGDSVPALVTALKEGDADVRRAAINLFLQFNVQEAVPAIPTLIEALKDPEYYVRFRSAVVLLEMGPPAAPAVPALHALLHDDSGEPRTWGAVAYVMLGGRDPQAVPVLVEALGVVGDTGLRKRAAQALARLGPEAKAAVPPLKAALNDPQVEVRQAAAAALRVIEPAK